MATKVDSKMVSVDTSNFDKNLSSADDNVQKALETIDDMTVSSTGGGEDTPVSISPVSETLTLDFNNEKNKYWRTELSSNTTIVFLNDENAVNCNLYVYVTPGNSIELTFPNNVSMEDGESNWNSITNVLSLDGTADGRIFALYLKWVLIDTNMNVLMNMLGGFSVYEQTTTTYAGNFDGSNIYGTVPDNAAFKNDYWEIEVKVKFTSDAENHRFFNLGGDGLSEAYGIELFRNINTLSIWCSWGYGTDFNRSETSAWPALNTDVVITAKRVGSVVKIYFDGVEQSYTQQDSYLGSMSYSSNGMFIGAVERILSEKMHGLIYYIKIWELDSSGNRVTDGFLYYNDFQNGPQGTTEANDADNAPAGTDMTWQGVPSAGDQYVTI